MRMDVAGAVYYPARLPPRARAAHGALAARGRSAPASTFVLEHRRSSGWRRRREPHRAPCARPPRGEIDADEFVLCAGSWSPDARARPRPQAADAGGQGLQPDAAGAPAALPRICAILTEARVAVTPMGGALRFGGTMELAGLDESIDPGARARHRRRRCRATSRTSRRRISTACSRGAACARARPTGCPTSAASRDSPICRSPPATP